jgi:hypothetical protein
MKFVCTGALTALLLAGLSAGAPPDQPESRIRFVEIGEKAGVRHVHRTRKFRGEHANVLGMFTSGGAVSAVGDYDNDGWEDLFVTSSDEGDISRLFRNEGDLTFSDQTEKAGVGGGNDPLSVVADALFFDYDNDGWQDLVVARFGTPLLYRNQGDGTFKDVSADTGMDTFANSLAVIAFDYDRDGKLDLLFGNYFPPVNLIELPTRKVLPHDLDNATNGGGASLWRNVGNGRFVDVTAQTGLDNQTGWMLAVGHGDFNNNGWPDIYMAGDYGTDRVYFNNGDGTFRDTTATSIGFDTKKGMNAEVADYNNDGFLDIYVTNITDEYMKECNMLWHNNGDETFTDLSMETGTCDTLWGWGAKFGDFDNNGWQDLFAVNGLRSASEENYIPVLVEMIIVPGIDFRDVANWPDIKDMTWSGYQKSKMFRNLGQMGIFMDISADAGVDNDLDGRGVAIADFDGDGLLDIYQTNADQPALLYHNRTANPGNWIALKLIGADSNRDAIGTRATLKAGGLRMIREVAGGNGYSAASTLRLHFGLGSATEIEELELRWPSGKTEKIQVPLNRLSYVEEGKGVVDGPTRR